MAVKWTELKTLTLNKLPVPAPWLVVLHDFSGHTHLRVEAEGSWQAQGSGLPVCSPDGLPSIAVPDAELVFDGCRFGALLGKVGGSSAAHFTPSERAAAVAADVPFALGSYCVIAVPDKVLGPLYVGFNAMWRPIEIDSLTVKISGATVP